ncbi:MAG: HypC/HybG/HupF family hydrogenase formation chaperone [Lachnospiraceae bacterium]|nr:HypC/HybG/HupF family hydrogenase formation chaperone [Lachnospiraceae bacterium]MBR3366256.1 HypC/HybG/HupF family hydrogenase formation chaperone [Lachnospiraceae bacterium]
MCVAYPGTVIEVRKNEHRALVDFSGTTVEAQTMFMDVEPGDQVLVHAGFVLEVLRDTEAAATKKVFHELSEITGRDPLYEEAAGAAGPDPDPIYDFYGTAAEERI